MRAPLVIRGTAGSSYVGASVGYACYRMDGDSSSLIWCARRRRNGLPPRASGVKVCGYARAMTEEASQRFELERGYVRALENVLNLNCITNL